MSKKINQTYKTWVLTSHDEEKIWSLASSFTFVLCFTHRFSCSVAEHQFAELHLLHFKGSKSYLPPFKSIFTFEKQAEKYY